MNDTSTITIEPETKASTSTSTALTVIQSALPTIIGADKDDILGKLAEKVRAFIPDPSSKKGQDAIRSLAAEIASSKMDLLRLGKSLTADWRKQTDAVNAECRVIEERMDALKVQVRQPLTDFENAQKARAKANEDAIATLESLVIGLSALTADEIKERYRQAGIGAEFGWAIEFTARAQRVRDGVVAQLQIAHQAAKQREADAAAEMVRQAEEAERARLAAIEAQRLREEQIARDAAEAARVAAEAKAARETEEAATRAREAERRAKEAQEAAERLAQAEREAATRRERQAAEALAQAERDKQEAEKRAAAALAQAKADAKAAAEQAEADRIAAVERERIAAERAEINRLAEVARAEREKSDAVEAERLRMEAARAADEAERARQAGAERIAAEKRAANVAHQRKVNGEILADMLKAIADIDITIPDDDETDIGTPLAKAIITAAAKGQIRHVTIGY